MNSMLSAIQAKRQGLGGAAVDERTMMDKSPEQDSGMPGLVGQLNDAQKQELLMLLSNEQNKSEGVEQGAPTAKERAIIAQKSSVDDQAMAMDPEKSDEIAMSMLDRDSLRRAEGNAKPRGLGDRAKMVAAKNLKDKGVIK